MITDIDKYISDIQAALNNDIGEGCINKLRANVLAHQVGLVRKELTERAAKQVESAHTDVQQAKVMPCLCVHKDLEGMRYELQIVKECPQHGHYRK